MNRRNFLFACIAIILCRLLASYIFCTFDDAYITFRYAQNLVAGNGLIYNLGEPVLGTTAPLFAFAGTIPLLLGIPVGAFFVVFNIACDLGSLYLICRYFLNGKTVLQVLFAILFALDPLVNRIAVGGMEANLFLVLSLLGIVLYFNQKKLPAFLLLSVIYFLRPEAILLFGIMTCYEWAAAKRFPWKYLICCLPVIAIPLLLMQQFYGHILPQSVLAKLAGPTANFTALFREIFLPHFFNYLLFPLAVAGILRKMRTNGYFLVSGIWLILYAAAYCVRGPWILNWYIYAIEVVQLIFASLAISEICGWLRIDLNRSAWLAWSLFLVILLWSGVAWHVGRSGVEQHVYAELKQDFTDRKDARKVFFADDIGALGFYTRGYIYDHLALVTPRALLQHDTRETITRLEPDYLFLYATPGYIRLVTQDSVLSRQYHFVKRYSLDGETNFPSLPEAERISSYRQDYLLFQRNESRQAGLRLPRWQ
jgi:hypothetical protein